MEITETLFDSLAHLARLQFSDSEKTTIRADLQKMVSFVEKLNEVDTTNVKPTVIMTAGIVQHTRADEVQQLQTTAQVLQNAPLTHNNYIMVPKVIENPNA